MAQRALLIFSDDTDSMEDLQRVLHALKDAPWKPNTTGTYGAPQERYSDAEVDAYVLSLLRRSAAKLHPSASVIVP